MIETIHQTRSRLAEGQTPLFVWRVRRRHPNGLGLLRVRNDDEIAPNTGFPSHPHANMEIMTHVREGALTDEDSLGNEGRTEAGDVQVMSGATGIRHGVSGKRTHERSSRVFLSSGAKSQIPGDPLHGYRQFEPDPSLGVHKSRHPQNGKSLSAKANSSKRGLTIRGTLAPSACLRARGRNPRAGVGDDDTAFAERRVS
jgi:hypothetical protein